ncbi:hypothetical protein [Streptosporangium vulgare]|uniref:hypothetical protein n=1 Tax=Streptosporangium vulgare TaxID=46190 RepID=UPI0031E0B2CC
MRTGGVAKGFRPADGVLLFEDPATISKIPALERPAFAKVAAAAHPGDVPTVSELFRRCRDLVDIHNVRNWYAARGIALRVLSGPLSNFHDLAANRRHHRADHQRAHRRRPVPARPAERTHRRGGRRDRGRGALPRPASRAGRRPARGCADGVPRGGNLPSRPSHPRGSRAAVRTALAGLLPDQPT